eukprot:s3046_g10.t1
MRSHRKPLSGGYTFAGIVGLTMIVPNVLNYLDPVSERLARNSFWPIEETGKRAATPTSWYSLERIKTMCARAVEEASRDHRRTLCLLEDLPQLAIALVYAFYVAEAKVSPFIVINIVVALGKTLVVFLGRPACLAWMAINNLTWPEGCISDKNVTGAMFIAGFLDGTEGKRRALEEVLRSEDAPMPTRKVAEAKLWELAKEFCPSDAFTEIDLVEYTSWMSAWDAVQSYCFNRAVPIKDIKAVGKKWWAWSLGSGNDKDFHKHIASLRQYADAGWSIDGDKPPGFLRPLLPFAFKCLEDSLPEQEIGVKILGFAGTEEAAKALLAWRDDSVFRHQDPAIRWAACRALGVAAWEPEVMNHARAMGMMVFEEKEIAVLRAAWRILTLKGSAGAEVVRDALLRFVESNDLEDEDGKKCSRLGTAIRWLGPDAGVMPAGLEEKLVNILQGDKKSKQVKEYAMLALLSLDHVEEVLVPILQREDDESLRVLDTLTSAVDFREGSKLPSALADFTIEFGEEKEKLMVEKAWNSEDNTLQKRSWALLRLTGPSYAMKIQEKLLEKPEPSTQSLPSTSGSCVLFARWPSLKVRTCFQPFLTFLWTACCSFMGFPKSRERNTSALKTSLKTFSP